MTEVQDPRSNKEARTAWAIAGPWADVPLNVFLF